VTKYSQPRTGIVALAILVTIVSFAGYCGINSRATAQASVQRAAEIVVKPGVASTHPATTSQDDFTFVGATNAPRISSLDAQNALADEGVPWALGGTFPSQSGASVTITAIYGVATLGRPIDTSTFVFPNGQGATGGCINWAGPCNLPVYKCVRGAPCTLTADVIPRLENRPAWVVDVGGATFYGSQISYNHTVYLVDEETKSIPIIWGYNSP